MIAKIFLSIQLSSIESERHFSVQGKLINKYRNRLKDNTINQQSFVN